MQQSEQFFSNKQLKRIFHLRILWEKDYVLPEMYDLPRVFPFLQPLACDSFYLYSLVSGAILA